MQFIAGVAALGLVAGAAAAPQNMDVKATSLTTTTTTKTKTDKTTTTDFSTITKTHTETYYGNAQTTLTFFQTLKATDSVCAGQATETVNVTLPASTVTAPGTTVYVTVSGGSVVGSATSAGTSKTASGNSTVSATSKASGNSTVIATPSAVQNTAVSLMYTATPVASVLQAQATALTSSPTSDVEGAVFDRFVIIWLENTDYEAAASDPNLASLATQGITLSQLFGVTHPSEPNYMASHGGDYFGLDGDSMEFVDSSVSSVIDLLDTKGISWAEYQEDMPYSGFEGYQYQSFYNNATHNDYVRKHNPAILYDSVTQSTQRLSQIKNFTMFYEDLENDALPQWMFITPNMTNDGHDTSVTTAGAWSKTFLEPLLNNTKFNTPKTLILLTFDENHTYTIQNNILGLLLGNAVPKELVGTTDSQFYNHYSQISTVSSNWDLPTLGRWDVNANVYSLVANKTGNVNKAWSTLNGTFPAFQNIAFNQSYPGVFNSKINNTGYPIPNINAVNNGRTVLPAVQSAFAGKSSSYYTNGGVGPMIYDGEDSALPPNWG